MAKTKAHAAVHVDMDMRQLEAAIDEIGSFTAALKTAPFGIANHVFNSFKNGFLTSVDTAAMLSAGTDPRGEGSFHHLYEPYEVGNPAERLFDLVVPQSVRSSQGKAGVYARIDYKASTEVEQPFGVVATQNMNARYRKYRSVPFWNKAEVLENGLEVTVPEGNTWAVEGGIRGFSKRSGQALYRNGISLFTSTETTKTSTRNEKTHNALLNHYNGYLRGGLADTAVTTALARIDKTAIKATIEELERELDKVRAKYKAGHSGTDRSRTMINRGKVFGFSPKSGRGNINKKYITYLEDKLQKLHGALDDTSGQ